MKNISGNEKLISYISIISFTIFLVNIHNKRYRRKFMKICENETFVNSRKIRTNSLFQTNYEENTDSDCFIKCEVVKYTNKFKENCTRHYKFDYMALDY